MRYTGPKNKLARREGKDLDLKTTGSNAHSSMMRRLNIKPGQNPRARRRKMTEYGQQLREKQALRRMYGLTESQLRKYFDHANRQVGNTATLLVQQLESRLDNVIYKLGFAPTRAAARQLVTHGHFMVNDKKVSIPSYTVESDDVITFKKEQTTKIPYVKDMLESKELETPSWLERKATAGKVLAAPDEEEFTEGINLQSVIEFYSR